MRRGNTWNGMGNGIRAAVEKAGGMSTYIYLEIVSILQRSRTTFINGVKNRKDLNLPLEWKINYHEYFY